MSSRFYKVMVVVLGIVSFFLIGPAICGFLFLILLMLNTINNNMIEINKQNQLRHEELMEQLQKTNQSVD